MNIFDRAKTWAAGLRAKSATAGRDTVSLNQLLDFLGVHNTNAEALSEATYFACLKVLSESVGKLPLKLQQFTPGQGIRVAREHKYYRMLNERPNRHMTASVFWGTMELCRLPGSTPGTRTGRSCGLLTPRLCRSGMTTPASCGTRRTCITSSAPKTGAPF